MSGLVAQIIKPSNIILTKSIKNICITSIMTDPFGMLFVQQIIKFAENKMKTQKWYSSLEINQLQGITSQSTGYHYRVTFPTNIKSKLLIQKVINNSILGMIGRKSS